MYIYFIIILCSSWRDVDSFCNSRGYLSRALLAPSHSIHRTRPTKALSENASPQQTVQSNENSRYLWFGNVQCRAGNIVEYVSSKGGRQLGYVRKISNKFTLELQNKLNMTFVINRSKLSTVILGDYTFADLLSLESQLENMKSSQIENVWEDCLAQNKETIAISDLSSLAFGQQSPLTNYLASKAMIMFGKMYFKPTENADMYTPLPNHLVQENIRDQAALQEFKFKFIKTLALLGKEMEEGENKAVLSYLPGRIGEVLGRYVGGLKQVVVSSHLLSTKQVGASKDNHIELSKGLELMEFLNLAPTGKNARKVLELIGQWTEHENLEKIAMNIRDRFPREVLEEAYNLLNNAENWVDPDERLRRDLRNLRTYAIDGEGTNEVDDAISIEYVELPQNMSGELAGSEKAVVEKLWIHIADVSAFIRPGSLLAKEAEERMTSIYMPDERISMLPEILATELLSLGAREDSYALSVGIVLNKQGEVLSYELCPSKIRVLRKLTYTQLDDILEKYSLMATQKKEKGITGSRGGMLTSQQLQECGLSIHESEVMQDLSRLYYWAVERHKYRMRQGALDEYVRDKTDLYLMVRKDNKFSSNSPLKTSFIVGNSDNKLTLTGYMSWANSSSVSLVSEYMILMSETVGTICAQRNIPVWFKTQQADPPLTSQELQILPNETAMIRSMRVLRHMKAAQDSYNISGPHATSGSAAYVQCTSPLRRYHDLYNHFQLKVAMHRYSVGDEWHDDVEEEMGVKLWKSYMKTPEQKIERMSSIRYVQKAREQYWMNIYIDKVATSVPKPVLDCVILSAPHTLDSFLNNSPSSKMAGVYICDAVTLQLGTQHRYKLLLKPNESGPEELPKVGAILTGYLCKWSQMTLNMVLLPVEMTDLFSLKL